ncbi:DUF4222 domain-containing protein [Yersinia artesiana]|uniref:DUF4222 domain-containing protein n=1 Tax=Yersinia artesiana TaxID=2890315 RepID=UPI0015835EB9|nr:DUF4222 domain-containing protein [Yersinia artesiana]
MYQCKGIPVSRTLGKANPIQLLDRHYTDWRGIRVHVIGYDSTTGWVIYRRQNYEHECFNPIRRFRRKFTRMDI